MEEDLKDVDRLCRSSARATELHRPAHGVPEMKLSTHISYMKVAVQGPLTSERDPRMVEWPKQEGEVALKELGRLEFKGNAIGAKMGLSSGPTIEEIEPTFQALDRRQCFVI